ncbi:hypothetical protein FIBSPDRAFT_891233 [Athelia psychrophila]|uniref:Uncharacterized protein n=1 Tax=Athelia psychrophila TaxID=1759441 RepID=A0A166JX05_9AGAM|nr:hypothetical protein FIBSPDRAFT_891233 [Fibularhizoctonia sp. CBS 109695]
MCRTLGGVPWPKPVLDSLYDEFGHWWVAGPHGFYDRRITDGRKAQAWQERVEHPDSKSILDLYTIRESCRLLFACTFVLPPGGHSNAQPRAPSCANWVLRSLPIRRPERPGQRTEIHCQWAELTLKPKPDRGDHRVLWSAGQLRLWTAVSGGFAVDSDASVLYEASEVWGCRGVTSLHGCTASKSAQRPRSRQAARYLNAFNARGFCEKPGACLSDIDE